MQCTAKRPRGSLARRTHRSSIMTTRSVHTYVTSLKGGGRFGCRFLNGGGVRRADKGLADRLSVTGNMNDFTQLSRHRRRHRLRFRLPLRSILRAQIWQQKAPSSHHVTSNERRERKRERETVVSFLPFLWFDCQILYSVRRHN